MEKQEIINLVMPIVLSGVLSGTFLNGIVTHILYNKKLKKEQKIKFENMIGEKVANALLYVNDLTKKSSCIEVYDAYNEMKNQKFDSFNGNTIYPEIMNDFESLHAFSEMIHICRKEHEQYLDCAMTLQVVFIDRYIHQLMVYSANFGTEKILPVLGTMLIFDIQKWQKNCDKMNIRRLNKAKYKMEYHDGRKYRILRKWILEKQWKESLLYKLINGPQNKKDQIIIPYIRELLTNVKEEPEKY